jgi:xylulokinase
MIANVYNCPVSVTANSEGAALGAGILAGVCGGVYSSVQDACDHIISTKRDCSPDPSAAARYDQFYDVYRSLYPMVKPAYTALSKL